MHVFFFPFCLDSASTGTVTSQFPLFPLIAQHAARSGSVHDYMTLLSRAEKSAAGKAIETECDYNN